MPTGTKIAAIVLVVLLGAAGLYYAFVPPAPTPKFDPSKGSTSGASSGSGITDPLARPSTLPPAGASTNATGGAGAGIDALAGRTGTNVPGTNVPGTNVPGTNVPGVTTPNTTVPGSTVPGSTVPNGAVAGTTTPGTTTPGTTTPGTNAPKYGFQNGRGTAIPPGQIGTGNNPTGTAGVNSGDAANNGGTAGTGTAGTGTAGTGAIATGTTGTGSAGSTSVAPTGSESTYVVKKGDTFETISKSVYGSTSKWKEIAKANPTVDPTRMKIGAKLRIPAAGASISSENAVATAAPKSNSSSASNSASSGGSKSTVAGATSSGTHVIAKGDTFSSLARTYYGDSKFWKAIAKANPKISEKSLAVGTKVAIPPKSAVVSGGNIER